MPLNLLIFFEEPIG